MPSSSPSSSESPSPSTTIRRWQHTDSPLLWSNAVVGSLILHLLILVPIARIWIGDRSVSGSEKLIAVEVLSPSDSSILPSPPSNITPQPSSPIAVNQPVIASATSPQPTATPATPTAKPTFSSPTPTPTPTPSSPTPTPTPTPTTEPPPGESDSPAANPPLPGGEIPPEESGGNPDVPPESSPPSSNSGASDAEDSETGGSNDGDTNTGDTNTGDSETGDTNTGGSETGDSETGGSETGGTIGGLVVYRKSELPAGGCGGSCPDNPAQPQITPGEGFSITYLPTERQCSGKTLVITALVSNDGNATSYEVNGANLDPNDPCAQIGSSMVNGWRFQPAQSGGSPVDSFLEIYLDLT